MKQHWLVSAVNYAQIRLNGGFYVLCRTPSWCLSLTATEKEEAAGRSVRTSRVRGGGARGGGATSRRASAAWSSFHVDWKLEVYRRVGLNFIIEWRSKLKGFDFNIKMFFENCFYNTFECFYLDLNLNGMSIMVCLLKACPFFVFFLMTKCLDDVILSHLSCF